MTTKPNVNPGSQVKVLDGNRAAAYGVMLCQPDVVCAYPITPQTEILEQLYSFNVQGLLNAEMVEVESEHAAMGVLRGAALAGGRTFTATAAQGLAFMYENLINVATTRLPVVMVNVCRQMIAPHVIASSQEDIMMAKEIGWIQLHAETCQEILDTVIMAYRLAEDAEIRIPVVVCYDGFFLSHLWERLEIPSIAEVQKFLPPLKISPRIDPQNPLTLGCSVPNEMGSNLRRRQSLATDRAKAKFDAIQKDFQDILGRAYSGQIEEYRTEDADIVVLAIGSSAGTARVAIDKKRESGLKVGLIKVKMFRPFPRERLTEVLKGKKAIGVLDRNVCLGWGSGHLFVELKAALYSMVDVPMLNFICGLTSMDIKVEDIEKVIDTVSSAAKGEPYKEVTWVGLE